MRPVPERTGTMHRAPTIAETGEPGKPANRANYPTLHLAPCDSHLYFH